MDSRPTGVNSSPGRLLGRVYHPEWASAGPDTLRLSGNRKSARRQGLGFPPHKGLGARASCPSFPACRPPVGHYAYY
eukprot:1192158-Prorocentrum_minimum.AAC.8